MGLGFGLRIHSHSLVESTVKCSNNGVEVNENGSIVKGRNLGRKLEYISKSRYSLPKRTTLRP
jgi:hypothetical protein